MHKIADMMNSDDDALVVDMDDNSELNVAHIRAQYEALLPMYGNLWRKMVSSSRPSTTPERQPLSLLPAIENQKAISLRVPTKQCQCPWDESCKGCAEPIVEIVDESSNDDEDEEALSSHRRRFHPKTAKTRLLSALTCPIFDWTTTMKKLKAILLRVRRLNSQ
jgi:hypothetical protein